MRPSDVVRPHLPNAGWSPSLWHGARHHRLQHQRMGSSSTSVPALGVAWHHKQISILCRAWVWGGPGRRCISPDYGFVPVAATPVRGPGAMAARRTAAASDGGGRLSCQSRPVAAVFPHNIYTTEIDRLQSFSTCSCCPWRWLAQVAASQRCCTATPQYRRDASWGSWWAAMATAAYSCRWAMAALVFGWGEAGGGNGGAARRLNGAGF